MRSHLRTVLAAALSLGLLALFFRNADFGQVWRAIRASRIDLVVLAVIVTTATYLIRAWRWQHLLAPIGRVRYGAAVRTTVIGFAASFLLPARAGEFLRPYLLARWEGLSATATFATIIIERLLDLMTVLLLFGAYVLFFDPGMASVDPRVYRAIQVGGLAAAGGSALAIVLMVILAGHPERLGRMALEVERLLPARVAAIVARLAQMFAEGLAVMRQPGRLFVALLLSVPLWLSIASGIWLVARAFDMTMPFTGSFLLIMLLVVGVAVPTPGAVGGFHEAFRIGATVFYQTPNDTAVAAALVLHAISFLPVTLIGVLFMARAGLDLGRVRSLADRAEHEAADPAVDGGWADPERPAPGAAGHGGRL